MRIEHDAGCVHTNKHHKASGRCRKGCECTRAARKAEKKEKARG